MQDRDKRMFGAIVRSEVYRGQDMSLTSKGEITGIEPVDHGARPLLGKFSQFNISYLTPEQRLVFLQQIRYELSLSGNELNQYLTQRYSAEDEYQVWKLQQPLRQQRKKTLRKAPVEGLTKVRDTAGLKRRIINKQRRKRTPEEQAEINRKRKETNERNKQDPNYVSYATIRREFIKLQKLVADRNEVRMKQAVGLFAEKTIARTVKRRISKVESENQVLKEYLRQNHLPLPGTKKAKMRRERLRSDD